MNDQVLKNKKLTIFLLLLLPLLVMAQPGLKPLVSNPILAKQKIVAVKQTKAIGDTLNLPFLEDFSGGQLGYPNGALFVDSSVYINPDFCIGPPTIGCATFDGLNQKGQPYLFALLQDYADSLTSRHINLSALTPADSVYFSFLYQPQGYGDGVENNDRLELRFYDNVGPLTGWVTVWQSQATPLDTFKQVMIPLLNTDFFTSGFKFQFRNFGALYGMYDIWNVDYIYLNSGRNKADTTYNDVAFVYKAPSLLADYKQMPYNQYQTSFTKINLTQTNINDNAKPVTYKFFSDYNQGGPNPCVGDFPAPDPLQPVYTNGYNQVSYQAKPDIQFCAYPLMTQETEYLLTHIFQSTDGEDINKHNDTIRYHQKFSDYYAFDDGTAEASYFIGGSAVQAAIRLKLNVPDTLRAVHFYFSQSYNDVQSNEFALRVWKASDSNPDEPGEVIYEKLAQYPVWQDSLNEFYTYYINDTLLTLPANQNFFVGWYQASAFDMQVGFDRNTDNADITFFKTSNSEWTQSPYTGTLMIRPAVGDSIVSLMGLPEPKLTRNFANVYLYPNPASSTVTILNYTDISKGPLLYTIYNLQGALVKSGQTNNGQIDVVGTPDGFYFVALSNTKGEGLTRKLIIAR